MQIDNLRKNSSVPEYLRKKFNSSYSIVEDNLDWFHLYHHDIGKWSHTTVHELGLEQESTIDSTIASKTTNVHSPEFSTVTPGVYTASSSSVSTNGQDYYLILLIISSISLINKFNFLKLKLNYIDKL